MVAASTHFIGQIVEYFLMDQELAFLHCCNIGNNTQDIAIATMRIRTVRWRFSAVTIASPHFGNDGALVLGNRQLRISTYPGIHSPGLAGQLGETPASGSSVIGPLPLR
jgi:hypothetical protein